MNDLKVIASIYSSLVWSFLLFILSGCFSENYSQESPEKFTNRLAKESSPYLQQHQHNPVDWYPWGEEAFARARKEGKPVLLSVGYSTCHWCHVMERESFENKEIAQILNTHFISIKVDREERPDIDNIYMAFVQRTTGGSGGWPMTVFMTADQKPFFGGTYFPPESKYGRAGFKELILQIAELWKTHQEDLLQDANRISSALKKLPSVPKSKKTLTEDLLTLGYQEYLRSFDEKNGGFNDAPKFPRAHSLSFLLRYAHRAQDAKAVEMVEKTLQQIQIGGVYDHIGGGVHRYSTDSNWLLPHFEKMLYDQAILSKALLETYQLTKNPEYAKTCRDIFEYVLRTMTSPEGGFYSAEDADSEGEEGKFYIWTPTEIEAILGKEDADFFCHLYQVQKNGNFRDEATGHQNIANILHLEESLIKHSHKTQVSLEALEARIAILRKKLYEAREKRIHPLKDDKILTDWNALMISSFALGGKILQEERYLNVAKKAGDFLLTHLYKEKILYHRYRQGSLGTKGFLDDYAFLGLALLDLYETTFEEKWLKASLEIGNQMVELFWDKKEQGFFFSASHENQLLSNTKEVYDGALPSGNSVATLFLLRLGRLTQQENFYKIGEQNLQVFADTLFEYPMGYPFMLMAVDFYFGPSYEIIFAGKPEETTLQQMVSALFAEFLPNRVIAFHPEGESAVEIEKLIPFIQYQKAQEGKTTVYICQNYQCELPTQEIEKMLSLLKIKR